MNDHFRYNRVRIVLVLCLAGMTACIPLSQQPQPLQPTDRPPTIPASTISPATGSQPATTPEEGVPKELELRPQLTLPGGLKRIEPTPENPVFGEVPETLLNEIIAELSQQLGVERSALEVIKGEAVVWNDGSLGCPQPGMFYTQALVNGYWVILRIGEEQYDYRASETGHFFRCESSGLPPIHLPGNPSSESPSDQ
jgi:hypothetical protein